MKDEQILSHLLALSDLSHLSNLVCILKKDVEFLKSEFYLTSVSAACLAAVGAAASEIWHLRTSKPHQSITIDREQVAIALSSHIYSKANGKSFGDLWDEFSGFYLCSDNRWIQLHCNYPHHRDNVLLYTGLERSATRKMLEEKLKENTAEFWERELTKANCCVGFVRTLSEWRSHEQYQAVKDLHLFDIFKMNYTPAIPFPIIDEITQPLQGIRVLELSRVLAGPTGCKILAQHGADVLKISSPTLPYVPSLIADVNMGKRSAFLDLDVEQDQGQFTELIKGCDVFFQAYRPNSLAAKGFGVEQLVALRPGIIYVTLSAYSHEGPWKEQRGFDSLVQSTSGIVSEQSNFLNPGREGESFYLLPVENSDKIWVPLHTQKQVNRLICQCPLKITFLGT